MSFRIHVGTFNSPKNSLLKNVTWGFETDGNLKEGCSLVNPVIQVEGNISDFHNYNYVRVYSWGRYYFITDIISVRSHLIELHMHCDVLTSFADEIEVQTGIVDRRQKGYNTYLNDGSIHVFQDRVVINYPISGGNNFKNKKGEGSYILALAGS